MVSDNMLHSCLSLLLKNSIDELLGVDPGIIRNLQSYFVGILNKYQRGEGRAQRAEARKKETLAVSNIMFLEQFGSPSLVCVRVSVTFLLIFSFLFAGKR